MQIPAHSGTAPFTLSVHDNSLTGVGITSQEAFAEVVALAELAERSGLERFWMSEHHAMPGAAAGSPQLMLARLTGCTSRIRLGAGGVMLPNHAPLVIAEQFGMLESLAPGRIDLGLGRAPGTDQATAAALRRHHASNDRFPQQIAELVGFLEDDFPEGHPYRQVHAVPGPWQAEQNRVPNSISPSQIWILGSSAYSAQLAAELGRPYAFALQFGQADVDSALEIYRSQFQASEHLERPHTLVSVGVIADDDPEAAAVQSRVSAMAMLRMFKREPYAMLPPDEVMAYQGSLQEQMILDTYTDNTLHGSAQDVAEGLERLHASTQTDELMMVVGAHDRAMSRRTVELMAEHYQIAAG